MGIHNSKKQSTKRPPLSKNEQLIISNLFQLASNNSKNILENELMKMWRSKIDSRLLDYINKYLFGTGEMRTNTVTLEHFTELFVFCTRGTADEKLQVLIASLGRSDSKNDIPHTLVKEYVESIVSSYMKMQTLHNTKQFETWFSRGCFISEDNSQKLTESLTHDLAGADNIDTGALVVWLEDSMLLDQLLQFIFTFLYNYAHMDRSQNTNEKINEEAQSSGEKEKCGSLVPFCRGLDRIPSYPSLLDLNQIVFINANLPQTCQLEWRFLFSSEIHGQSFSALLKKIVDQGPSVLVVQDKNGYMFGGFASANWHVGPTFFGNDSSFLFTLVPRMRIFQSTGYNQHFQYLNLNQKTIPNGLGMGGQHDYNGLWIDSMFSYGHSSESCTTYAGYHQLSYSRDFVLRHLEVWGVGTPQRKEEMASSSSSSILDSNYENKAMLAMAGRSLLSEDIRERHSN